MRPDCSRQPPSPRPHHIEHLRRRDHDHPAAGDPHPLVEVEPAATGRAFLVDAETRMRSPARASTPTTRTPRLGRRTARGPLRLVEARVRPAEHVGGRSHARGCRKSSPTSSLSRRERPRGFAPSPALRRPAGAPPCSSQTYSTEESRPATTSARSCSSPPRKGRLGLGADEADLSMGRSWRATVPASAK